MDSPTDKRSSFCHGVLIYFWHSLKLFLRNTVLNGLKYLAFESITFWEKLFFLICFIAAAYNSLIFSIDIVDKWQTSPVLIVMNPEATSITQEPFPAVTICNMNQASLRKTYHYPNDTQEYAMLQKICFQDLDYTTYAQSRPRSKKDTFANFIANHAQTCEEMVVKCQFGSSIITCTDLFREVLLDEGICCSFNILHPFMQVKGEYIMVRDYTSTSSQWVPVDWHPEEGYPKELPKYFYPRPAKGEGTVNGLSLILNANVNDYYCSSTNGAGFKIALHNPIDIPHVKETGVSVALGHQTNLRVLSLKEEATSVLRSLRPRDRQCYFSDEHSLEYFRYYTRRNCEMECDSKFMLRTCQCIPYHMPLIRKNVTVCHLRHFDCETEAEKIFEDLERLGCQQNCLSSCHDLTFNVEAFFNTLAESSYEYVVDEIIFRNFSREYITENMAFVNIYFGQSHFRSNVKSPYTGMTEYLSQTGGIMSLMMGFSVISLVELAYFFIVKPLFEFYANYIKRYFQVDVARSTASQDFSIDPQYMRNIKSTIFSRNSNPHVKPPVIIHQNFENIRFHYNP